MFTGLVEETGRVSRLERTPEGLWRMTVEAKIVSEGLALGDSVANNGCCLTAALIEGRRIRFDLLDETMRKTSFAGVKEGSLVNLERSVTPSTRLGGHFVTGHIDGTGVVEIFEQRGANHLLRIRPPAEFLKYLVYKGCVAIDGISLTVAEVHADTFDLWLIPHTLEKTNLHERRSGDVVNLEFDILAKYVERLAMFPAKRD
jgi:riboflavin synthase